MDLATIVLSSLGALTGIGAFVVSLFALRDSRKSADSAAKSADVAARALAADAPFLQLAPSIDAWAAMNADGEIVSARINVSITAKNVGKRIAIIRGVNIRPYPQPASAVDLVGDFGVGTDMSEVLAFEDTSTTMIPEPIPMALVAELMEGSKVLIIKYAVRYGETTETETSVSTLGLLLQFRRPKVPQGVEQPIPFHVAQFDISPDQIFEAAPGYAPTEMVLSTNGDYLG